MSAIQNAFNHKNLSFKKFLEQNLNQNFKINYMKNLFFASVFALATLALCNNAAANTYPSVLNSETIENVMKPKVKIRLSWNGGFNFEIEITFRTAPGGNDNGTGTFDAKGIQENGVSAQRAINESGVSVKSNPKKIDVMSWSWGASNGSSMLNGASEIVVTKGVTLPNGQVISIGDRLVLTANGFTIVSPRDAASGLSTGK